MRDETADSSIEMMAPELYSAEAPLEATHPLPAASTAARSVTETLPPKEPPGTTPTTDKQTLIPQDCTMAMENNPVTTAGKDVLGAYNNATDQETRKPTTTPESSAIGWMVHTPAATPSKISFDGS